MLTLSLACWLKIKVTHSTEADKATIEELYEIFIGVAGPRLFPCPKLIPENFHAFDC